MRYDGFKPSRGLPFQEKLPLKTDTTYMVRKGQVPVPEATELTRNVSYVAYSLTAAGYF